MSATVTCGAARELFPAYLEEALPTEERSGVRAHLMACPACRREASTLDPALLFAALSGGSAPEVSATDTAKILAAVRSGIALKSAEKRIDSASRSRRHRFAAARTAMTAAAAAAAVAAVALAWTLAPRTGAVRIKPLARVSAPQRDVSSSQGGPAPALEGGKFSPFAAASGPADARGGSVQGRLPADATVYDWNPGGGQPRVVWIVDHSLDI